MGQEAAFACVNRAPETRGDYLRPGLRLLEKHFQRELKLPPQGVNRGQHSRGAGQLAATVEDLCLGARRIREVCMVCDVERLRLKLQMNALGYGLFLHQSGSPEKQSRTGERITPACAQSGPVQAIAIRYGTGKRKARSVDVVDVARSNARAAADPVGELERL